MTSRSSKKHKRYGFTMVELMAILVIIGLLMTVVATKVASKVEQARETTTKANLKILHAAVNQFMMDTARYPYEDEGLTALIQQPSDVTNWEPGGYLETTEIPKDGWQNDFVYEVYADNDLPFVIRSYGKDREPDTDDDLLSTDAN
ncbi:MAG: type II secretion system major pseudopilin GspG [Sedimentisphaerales bacterium]|nr:type II secretion system major pseudopilin GspG [Sedimentisphaerales bacterium]